MGLTPDVKTLTTAVLRESGNRRAMLKELVGRLKRKSRTQNGKSGQDSLQQSSGPPLLASIQRMMDKCEAEVDMDASCSDDACCVCLSRTATVRAYPCGHMVSCRLCATIMLKASAEANEKHFRCVICRSNIFRFRYARPEPITIICKNPAPYELNFSHPNESSGSYSSTRSTGLSSGTSSGSSSPGASFSS